MTKGVLVTLVCLSALGCSDSGHAPPAGQGTSGGSSTGGTGAGGVASGGTSAHAGGTAGTAGTGGASAGAGGGSGASGWGPAACSAAPAVVGYSVGESIGEPVVDDCDTGEPRSIDELCGAAATWIFVAHSHCPTCKATANFTPSVAKQVASQNVAIAHIMYDDNGTSCTAWKQTYELEGIPNVKVYQDPTGAVWSKLKTSNYTAPSAFLNAERVITYQAHGLTESEVLSRIDEALGK